MALAMIGQAKTSHLLLAHRRLSIKAHKALCFLPTLSLSLQTLYSQVDKLSTIKQGLPFWGAMRLRVNNMLFHPIIKVVGLIPITPLTLQAFPTQVGSQTTHIWALKRLTTMLSGIWSMPLRFQKTLNLVPPPIYSTNSLPTSRQATDYQPYLNIHEQEERRDWSLWRV
jgi:hypothetical protein